MDYSAADEIAQVFREEAGPEIAQHFHADTYAIYSVTSTNDGYGGVTEVETLVESGRCEVITYSANWGGVRLSNGVVISEARYAIEMPLGTAITTNHTVKVNGRRFTVDNVVRGGNAEMFVAAALNEKGPRT